MRPRNRRRVRFPAELRTNLPDRRTLQRAIRHRHVIPSGGRPGHRESAATSLHLPPRSLSRALDRHPTGRDVLPGKKCTPPSSDANGGGARSGRTSARLANRRKAGSGRRMNLPVRSFGFLRFTPERFHVLLNSLFKVLFNFPSRYLFAIGHVVIFSLRWSLPPA